MAATRKLLGAYLVPLLILLVATKTRSAWLGCVIIFTVYGLIADKRVLVMTLALPLLALFVPAVRERLADLSTGNEYVGWVQDVNAYAWRKLLWEKAVAYIAQRPLFGYGLYSFPYYSPSFFPLETERGVDAHNVYVQLLFETGIMGLLSYLWIFVRQFQTLLRYLKLDRPALAMSMTMICVYLVTCYSRQHPGICVLWLVLLVSRSKSFSPIFPSTGCRCCRPARAGRTNHLPGR